MTEVFLEPFEYRLLQKAYETPDGVSIGGITTNMGVSIRDATNAFRHLRKLGFLKQKGGSLVLTALGRSWISKNQNLFAFTGRKTWREVPSEFETDALGAFEPYAPRLSKLAKAHFGIGGIRSK